MGEKLGMLIAKKKKEIEKRRWPWRRRRIRTLYHYFLLCLYTCILKIANRASITSEGTFSIPNSVPPSYLSASQAKAILPISLTNKNVFRLTKFYGGKVKLLRMLLVPWIFPFSNLISITLARAYFYLSIWTWHPPHPQKKKKLRRQINTNGVPFIKNKKDKRIPYLSHIWSR